MDVSLIRGSPITYLISDCSPLVTASCAWRFLCCLQMLPRSANRKQVEWLKATQHCVSCSLLELTVSTGNRGCNQRPDKSFA